MLQNFLLQLFTVIPYLYHHSVLWSYITVVITMEWQYITIVKSFVTFAWSGKLTYRSNLLQNFNPRKCRYFSKLPLYFYNIGPCHNIFTLKRYFFLRNCFTPFSKFSCWLLHLLTTWNNRRRLYYKTFYFCNLFCTVINYSKCHCQSL